MRWLDQYVNVAEGSYGHARRMRMLSLRYELGEYVEKEQVDEGEE